MINAHEIEMYPALLIQQVIHEGIKEFIPRYLLFQDEHASTLVELMKIQNHNLLGQEPNVWLLWEKMGNKQINQTFRI